MHSTRLFPKNRGATAYKITGIASRCDWVILSDNKPPRIHLFTRIKTKKPKHIFISLRNPFEVLIFFAKKVLPGLNTPFVLISGSEDVTIPNQIDQRWRSFNSKEVKCIKSILTNPLLTHWFTENLDDASHPKMSPLPGGMMLPGDKSFNEVLVPSIPNLGDRPLRILCAHRIRKGPQWSVRTKVSQLVQEHWSQWSTILNEEIPEANFLDLVKKHSFVLCAEGGGLDPCPKAWHSILYGAIPIVRLNALHSAYSQLPIAFVPDWKAEHINLKSLQNWHNNFSPLHDNNLTRQIIIKRLSIDYWWGQILVAARRRASSFYISENEIL